MYRDEWTKINDVRLHWQDWGAREAPVVLMLHGLTQQSHTFDHGAERLGDRYRCIGGWRFKFDAAIGKVPPPSSEAMKSAAEIWWHTLASLRCPILLVRGADSDVLSRATAEEMERRQPALVRIEVPDMGHAPMLSELAALAALDRFYKG